MDAAEGPAEPAFVLPFFRDAQAPPRLPVRWRRSSSGRAQVYTANGSRTGGVVGDNTMWVASLGLGGAHDPLRQIEMCTRTSTLQYVFTRYAHALRRLCRYSYSQPPLVENLLAFVRDKLT